MLFAITDEQEAALLACGCRKLGLVVLTSGFA
jgi:hypothetical protein